MVADYRERLYGSYVSGFRRPGDNIARDTPYIYRAYFGCYLPPNKDSRILDLGCGDGFILRWLKSEGYECAWGVDYSSEAIEEARKAGIENVCQASASEFLKDKAGKYDVIFMLDFLEHFRKEEVLPLLDLVYKALSKEGVVIIRTPNGCSPLASMYRYYDFTHENMFTVWSLSQVLRATGFTDINIHPQRPVVHGVLSLGRYIIWLIFESVIRLCVLSYNGVSDKTLTNNMICEARKRVPN
jgi:2-polyprenyl-3-methyl-5-hydroxy-6-metoxy-1,4-benzoquinol methylase